MVHTSEKELAKDNPEIILPPPIPESVVKVWGEYERLSGVRAEQDQLESAEIAARLRDFAGKTELPSSVYHTAYLIRLSEKLSGDEPQASYAKQALESYKGEPVIDAISDEELIEIEERLYILGLDRAEKNEVINGLAKEKDKKYVLARARDTLEIGRTLRKRQQRYITKREAKQLSGQKVDSPWAIPTGEDSEVSIKWIANLTSDISDAFAKNPKGVNIESMIINAISAYKKLEDLDGISESEALKIVYAIDNLYQPFIALIRWDGLENGLKEQVKLTRMVYGQGLEGVFTPEELSKAKEKKKAAGLHDIKVILALVPKVLENVFLGNNATVESSIYDMSEHGNKTGTAKIFPGEAGDYLELEEFIEGSSLSSKWRAKGDASAAESIHKDPNDHISDLFGMLIKVPTYEVAAEMIITAYKSLDVFENMQRLPSASREAFIVLQGNEMPPTVLAILTKELGDLGPNIETTTKSNGYQAAKITFSYTHKYKGKEYKTPIEVMFQTPKDRQIATVGSAAHLHKVSHLPKDDEDKYREPKGDELGFQGQVSARKDKIGKPGVTAISQLGADLYFRPNNKQYVKTNKMVKGMGRSSII